MDPQIYDTKDSKLHSHSGGVAFPMKLRLRPHAVDIVPNEYCN